MLIELTPSLIFSLIGTLISIISMIFAYTNSAKKLEHRLTSLELKVEPLWDAVRTEIPKLLIKSDTPELDKLLRHATNGFDTMTDEQIQEMNRLLHEEYTKALENKDAGRAVGIALFRATLKERIKDDL